MCGITGYYCFNPKKAIKAKKYLTELLIQSSFRGQDATGIGYLADDNEFYYFKKPEKAEDFVKGKRYLKIIREQNPTIVIAHTRAKTKGSEKDNNNNHPISTPGGLLLVHNGILWNDDEVTKDFKLKRRGEVDSEVIPLLIEHFKTGETDTIEAVKKAMQEIRGSIAFAMLDINKKDNLYLMASGNPIALAYSPKIETVFFASTVEILERSLFTTGIVKDIFSTQEKGDFLFREYKGIVDTGLTITPDKIFSYSVERKTYATYDYTKKEKSATVKKEIKPKKNFNVSLPIQKPSQYTTQELSDRADTLEELSANGVSTPLEETELIRISNTIIDRAKKEEKDDKKVDFTLLENRYCD